MQIVEEVRRRLATATAELEAAKEEFELAFVLSNSTMEFHLHVKKDD